jgi:HD-GYP domain-containing protein (c-di-GMP phosphodiesterase class II)
MFHLWKRLTLTAKITILFTTLNVLIFIAYTALIVNVETSKELRVIDTELATAVKSYLLVIGEEKLDRAFTGSVPKEEYVADVSKMGDYAGNLGLRFLYSMTVIDSKAKFVHDGAPKSYIDEGNKIDYPMDDYPDASPKLFAAWNTWTPHIDEYTDSYGSFRSYFLPAVTSGGNKIIIGADIGIDVMKQRLKRVSTSHILIASGILAFNFIITLLCSKILAGQMINRNMAESKNRALLELQNSILKTMASLTEFRDDVTSGHVERTQQYLGILLNAMKKQGVCKEEVSSWDIDLVLQSAQLHDIGKIAIEDSILKKPGPLTFEEFEQIKEHTVAGEKIILKMGEHVTEQAFLEYARVLAYTHHEKWDGTGYPNGLKGEGIPLLGRAMAIVDVYDALVSNRPYKGAFSHEQAIEIIKNGSGTHFDPMLVDLFVGAIEDSQQG